MTDNAPRRRRPRPRRRVCERCPEPLSITARADARYCSIRCQVAAWRAAR
jgi:hypothetical protein